MERRLVAILAADVVGYSREMEAAEEQTAEEMAKIHFKILNFISQLPTFMMSALN